MYAAEDHDPYRLAEEEIIKHITITDPAVRRSYARGLVQAWFLRSAEVVLPERSVFKDVVLDTRRAGIITPEEAAMWCNDAVFLVWAETMGATVIAQQLKVRSMAY